MTFIDIFLTVAAIGVVIVAFIGVWCNYLKWRGEDAIDSLPALTDNEWGRKW